MLLSWAAADRLALHAGRADVEVAVRATMAAAVADLVTAWGVPVEPQCT